MLSTNYKQMDGHVSCFAADHGLVKKYHVASHEHSKTKLDNVLSQQTCVSTVSTL